MAIGLDNAIADDRQRIRTCIIGVGCIVGVCQLAGIGIESGYYIEQTQLCITLDSQSKRDADLGTIGFCRTCVCRNKLFVNIELTTDVPIVCGRCILSYIFFRFGITIVDNALQGMDEVTRCLHFILGCCCSIFESTIGNNILVCRRQHLSVGFCITWFAMNVLSIDIATTLTRADIEQVEFDDTRNRTINLVAIVVEAFYQFQEHTRCECNLIGRSTVVTIAFPNTILFPLIVSGDTVGFIASCCTARLTYGSSVASKMHIGSNTAKKFHHIVDAKVAAVRNIVNLVLVEREFANTVDGIIGVVGFCLVLSTVDGTTQDKAATLDATEVASLHCVDITAFVDNRFLGLPIATLILGKTIIFFAHNDITNHIFVIIRLTCIFGNIKRFLTVCQLSIIF